MGARIIRRRGPSADRNRREYIALAAISAAIGLPLILGYILVAADMRIDLSDLQPAKSLTTSEGTVTGWRDLTAAAGRTQRTRIIGYMMDGNEPSRAGDLVTVFVLLPEAGQFLHPAHRFPEQMVEVRLTAPVPFRFRHLVWVAGILSCSLGWQRDERAMYVMDNASVEDAYDRDIQHWFRP